MAERLYYKIEDGSVVAREMKDPTVIKNGADGNPVWRPFEEVARPTIDGRVQTISETATIENGRVLQVWTVSDKPLADVKTLFKAKIDGDADDRQLALMQANVSPVKTMIYNGRAQEADVIQSDGSPDAATYPFLAALVGSDYGADLAAVGTAVRAERALVAAALAAIDGAAVAGKNAVDDAATNAAVVTAYNAIRWP